MCNACNLGFDTWSKSKAMHKAKESERAKKLSISMRYFSFNYRAMNDLKNQRQIIILSNQIMSLNLEKSANASTPILVLVSNVNNSLSRKKYVAYYQIPSFPGSFRSLDHLEEIFLPSPIIKFKILNLAEPENPPILQSADVIINENGGVMIEFKLEDGGIKIEGKIINQTKEEGKVFAMNIVDRVGYSDFYNFRKKYKTLENLTRKQEFSLDHRLKVAESASTFYYTMDADDQLKFFFTGKKLKLEIEQIYSIEEWQNIETIHEETVDLNGVQSSQIGTIVILNKLKLTIGIQIVKNQNLSMCDMVSLRVLELNEKNTEVVIGTDKYEESTKVFPVLDESFYDYQYAYLKKNLEELKQDSIHNHLSKLTPCFPKYPHFINQRIIQVKNAKFLHFKVKETLIKIPFVYVLKGFNVFNTEKYTIKFLIQAEKLSSQDENEEEISGKRKIMHLKIKEIWNLGSLNISQPQFDIKIISQNQIYEIPFEHTQVQISAFRKLAKQLKLKEEYSEKDKNKFYIIKNSSQQKDHLSLFKTEHLQEFYLFDLQSSGSISFQISSQKELYVVGSLTRKRILNSKGQIKLILSSNDNLEKVVFICEINEIQQQNSSLKSLYRIRHRLFFTDDNPCDDSVYDLQIRKNTNNKKLRTKVYPEMKSQFLSILKEFDEGFFQPLSASLDLTISLRKMFYDEELETFDNEEIVSKRVIANPEAQQTLEKNCLFVKINEENFESVEYDFYDSNIKKKLKLYIEIYRCQSPLFDLQSASYAIKIPHYFWKLNSIPSNSPISLEMHYSRKKKKSEKISLYNDSAQENILPFYNHKDGISISVGNQTGYSKVIEVLTARCEVVKDNIGWINESQWFLSILKVGKNNFYFLIKCFFDPNAGRMRDSDGSAKSDRTVGKQASERSYNEKIDPLAKTINNMEMFKLKKMKNDLVLEGRQLTTKYVKREEMIISLSKKITEAEELVRKKREYESEVMEGGQKRSKDVVKMTSFYRSICQCGAKNPKFNGFCEECLKKLRKRYQTYLKQYKQKAYEYEKICFNKFNTKQKLIRVKNKLKLYQQKIKSGQRIEENNVEEIFKELEEKELKRKIQQIKIQLFRLEEERKSMAETALYQQTLLQERIKKEDEEIWEGSQELQRVVRELQELKEKIRKKKRIN